MNKLQVFLNFRHISYKVGELFLSEKLGRYVFNYDPVFLSSGLELSPYILPLGDETFIAERNNDMYNLHSLFADALPDDWGRKVQDAEFQNIGIYDVSALERLSLNHSNLLQQVVEVYRRMVFNYLGGNKDDHAKNFSFLMDKNGQWHLSPAYDLAYSSGDHGLHAMAAAGKRRNLELRDFEEIADNFDIREWRKIIDEIKAALECWRSIAKSVFKKNLTYTCNSVYYIRIGAVYAYETYPYYRSGCYC